MRMIQIRTALLLFGAIALFGQQAPPEAPKTARMEGAVVTTAGAAVPRARVRLAGAPSIRNGALTPAPRFEAITDDAGKFVIESIEPGQGYSLTAEKAGFVTARYGARSANSSPVALSLEPGQTLQGLTLRMSPQGTISGRVIDSNGDPMQGAIVAVQRRGYVRGVRQLLPAGNATTDDRGEFRIANVPAGRYTVTANVTRASLAVSADKTAPLLTYYPNAADARSAAFFSLSEGQEMGGVQIQMRQGVVYSASGRAVDASGAAASGALAMATPKGASIAEINGSGIVGTTGGDGAFTLRGLVPGTYAVIVQNLTSGTRGVSEFTITDKDTSDVRVAVGGGSTLKGTVRLVDGDLKDLLPPSDPKADRTMQTALAAATAVAPGLLGAAPTGGLPSIALVESGAGLALRSAAALLDQDGTLTFENVSVGDYKYSAASLPAGTYVKSVQFGGTDVTHSLIHVTGSGGALDVVLARNAPSVSGSIVNDKGEAQAGVTVALWTRDPDPGSLSNGVAIATTDRNGGFQFQSLAPGTYYAAAFEDIDSGLAQARELLALMTGDAAQLALKEGSSASPSLKIIPLAKISAAEEKLP